VVVLFAGRANATRTQLAEAIARHLAPAGWEFLSAGGHASHVRPAVREVLNEQGIDAHGLRAKRFYALDLDEVQQVVTLCDRQVCPELPDAVRHHHWPLPDPSSAPAEERLEAFRACRDELLRRIPTLFLG